MSRPAGLIDVHSHHYPDAYLDACRRPDSGFTHYYRDDGRLIVLQDGAVGLAVPQPLPPLEHRIGMMDDAGVEVQVLSVSAPNVFRFPAPLRIPLTRDLNDELSELAASSGGRLLAFASLPLPAVDAALAELDRALALPHVAGVTVCSNIDRVNLDDERFSPLWEELSRRGTTVFCHPTVACCTDGLREYAMSLAMGFMADTMFAVGRLAYAGTFDRYPGINWIFTHLGGTIPFVLPRYDNYHRQFPECREHIDRPPSEIMRGLYYDTCTMHAPALRCALDTLGPERLLFGSDYPHVPGGIDRFVSVLGSVGLSEEELALIGRRTAAGLVGLEASRAVPVGEP
jgi:predicted TIM-barrel fold metal-dependent hydrolase